MSLFLIILVILILVIGVLWLMVAISSPGGDQVKEFKEVLVALGKWIVVYPIAVISRRRKK